MKPHENKSILNGIKLMYRGRRPRRPAGPPGPLHRRQERHLQRADHVQDQRSGEGDDRLRRMCGRITPGKRLAVILVMFLFFGGLSIYITVSSIYNMGKRDGQRLQIEHIRQLPLQGNDTINSINPLNRPEYGRSTEE